MHDRINLLIACALSAFRTDEHNPQKLPSVHHASRRQRSQFALQISAIFNVEHAGAIVVVIARDALRCPEHDIKLALLSSLGIIPVVEIAGTIRIVLALVNLRGRFRASKSTAPKSDTTLDICERQRTGIRKVSSGITSPRWCLLWLWVGLRLPSLSHLIHFLESI
jgi:hypothetical protein